MPIIPYGSYNFTAISVMERLSLGNLLEEKEMGGGGMRSPFPFCTSLALASVGELWRRCGKEGTVLISEWVPRSDNDLARRCIPTNTCKPPL